MSIKITKKTIYASSNKKIDCDEMKKLNIVSVRKINLDFRDDEDSCTSLKQTFLDFQSPYSSDNKKLASESPLSRVCSNFMEFNYFNEPKPFLQERDNRSAHVSPNLNPIRIEGERCNKIYIKRAMSPTILPRESIEEIKAKSVLSPRMKVVHRYETASPAYNLMDSGVKTKPIYISPPR